jgi:GNAT superfamily N-acetyltransferase
MSTVLPLERADLPAVMGLVEREGWQGYSIQDLELIMAVSPEACFKLVDGRGVLVGSIFTLITRRASYLSFFLIDPEYRSFVDARALGLRAIATALQSAAVIVTYGNRRAVNAYLRHGFLPQQWVTRHGVALVGDGDPAVGERVVPVPRTAIAELDQRCHHTDRAPLLAALSVYDGIQTFGYRGAGGGLTGYAMVRTSRGVTTIGPVVAEHDDEAAALIAGTLARVPSRTAIIELTDERLPARRSPTLSFTPTTVSVRKMYQGDPSAVEDGRMLFALGGHHFS